MALIQKFRPYAAEGMGRTWHDQIKSILYVVGTLMQMAAVPEYPVPSPKPRHGKGRIDLVWTSESTPVAAFEIEGGISLGSIRKLESFDAPHKFVISAGKSGQKMRWLGSPRLVGNDIEHLVIEPTADSGVCTASVFEIVDGLIECEVDFEGTLVETELSRFAGSS